MAPDRKIVGFEPDNDRTVDSMPWVHGPPSRMRGILPSNSCRTAEASVGLIRPNRFALGAAIGCPSFCRSSWAAGWAGYRMATVGRPAVTPKGTRGPLGNVNVSGPGQNWLTRATAKAGIGFAIISSSARAAKSAELT